MLIDLYYINVDIYLEYNLLVFQMYVDLGQLGIQINVNTMYILYLNSILIFYRVNNLL